MRPFLATSACCRRPWILWSLAAGVFFCLAIDFAARVACPVDRPWTSYRRVSSLRATTVRVEWASNAQRETLRGFLVKGWEWSDLDLSTRFRLPGSLEDAIDSSYTVDQAARRLSARAVLDTTPFSEMFGTEARLRVTQFGFPFRTSVREAVSGVTRNDRLPCSSSFDCWLVNEDSLWTRSKPSADSTQLGRQAVRNWVLPSGIAFNILSGAAFVWVSSMCCVSAVRWMRRRRNRCVSCGYLLVGLDSACCPECGVHPSKAQVHD